MNQLDSFSILVDGLDHPEGVAWGPDGMLYAGGEAGQLYRVDVQRRTFEEIANTNGFVLGLALDGNQNAYLCDSARKEIVRVNLAEGKVTTYSRGSAETPARTPNWPVFDSGGNLYYSDSGEWKADDGVIFRVTAKGQTTIWSRAAHRFPNGMALNPDQSHLYVVESLLPGVSRIAVNSDGSAGEHEVVVDLPQTVPDGIAFAEDGTLWIACYTPDRIFTLDSAARLELIAEDWTHTTLASPTNLAFAGDSRDLVVVGSLGRWHLAGASLGVRGAALNYPKFG